MSVNRARDGKQPVKMIYFGFPRSKSSLTAIPHILLAYKPVLLPLAIDRQTQRPTARRGRDNEPPDGANGWTGAPLYRLHRLGPGLLRVTGHRGVMMRGIRYHNSPHVHFVANELVRWREAGNFR